jgi:pyridoxal phosphate enzyme (YggS family)
VTRITEQLAGLQRRIETAAERAGRDPQDIRILAVSKRQSVDAIRRAQAAGLRRFGENYLQEALGKMPDIVGPVEWHFIGPIQSNKTRTIAENFAWVHTVANRRVAQRLANRRPPDTAALNICIQLRPGNAPARAGIDFNDAPALADLIADLPEIRLRGLMVMPLPDQPDSVLRAEFARTRDLLETLRGRGHDVDTLSMGMSSDLEAAIMEGSTLVRIGTDLFGPRNND